MVSIGRRDNTEEDKFSVMIKDLDLDLNNLESVVDRIQGPEVLIYPRDKLIEFLSDFKKMRGVFEGRYILEEILNIYRRLGEIDEREKKDTETIKRSIRSVRKTLKDLVMIHQEEREEEKTGSIGFKIVGSEDWVLNKGDKIYLTPGLAYTYEDGITRKIAYFLPDKKEENSKRLIDIIVSGLKRKFVGESFILDCYTSDKKGATLGISSNQIGSSIIRIDLNELESKELIARKCCYLGHEEGVKFDMIFPDVNLNNFFEYGPIKVHLNKGFLKGDNIWPLSVKINYDFFKTTMDKDGELGFKGQPKDKEVGITKIVYGPSYVFQRFRIIPGIENRAGVFIHMEGDWEFKKLKESKPLNPIYIYAWEGDVNLELNEFGSRTSRVILGDVPYWMRYKSGGSVLRSNYPFEEGYLGFLASPSTWSKRAINYIQSTLPF